MTAAFWVLFAAYVVKSAGFVLLYRSHQRLAALTDEWARDLGQAEAKHLEYRAAYRDLIGDYERLHARYKEIGGGNDR
jgi:hypothetical protein